MNGSWYRLQDLSFTGLSFYDRKNERHNIASISNIVAIRRRKQPAGLGHQQGGRQSDGRAGEAVKRGPN